jgi:hypothetical protein
MAGDVRQEWTWRDMFRSIGLAFSFSRLVTGLLGVVFLTVADGLLVMASGSILNNPNAWMQWLGGEVFGYLRLAVAGLIFLLTATAIAYSAKGELLEGEGAGVGESIAFAFRKFGAVFLTPVLFWVYIALMGGFAFVFFVFPVMVSQWIGWTPLVSLIWCTLGYIFVFLFSVLSMMGFLAFLFAFFLSPSIIAVRQEGALDAVLDTIDLMRGKGAFWVSIIVLVIAGLIGGAQHRGTSLLVETTHVGYKVVNRAIGGEFGLTVSAMPSQIKPPKNTMMSWTKAYWPDRYAASGQIETRHKIAGWILGIWVLLVAGFSVSFALGAFVSAGTLTYLIVREEEEFLEPVIEGPPKAPTASDEKMDEKKDEKEEKKDDEDAKKDSKREKKDSRRSKKKE